MNLSKTVSYPSRAVYFCGSVHVQSMCAQQFLWKIWIWSEQGPHLPSGCPVSYHLVVRWGWRWRDWSHRQVWGGFLLCSVDIPTLLGQEQDLRGCNRSLRQQNFLCMYNCRVCFHWVSGRSQKCWCFTTEMVTLLPITWASALELLSLIPCVDRDMHPGKGYVCLC